jgi:hypothetical protein
MTNLPIIKFNRKLARRYKAGTHVGLTWSDGASSTTPAVIEILDRRTARVLSCTAGFGVSPVLRCGRPLVGLDAYL